ncbi:MAG: hypothetical protein HOP33_08625 [Verrucomicrobia bacterium]|nr:hypothetical protein [Verrucomicrobiota bacterium]
MGANSEELRGHRHPTAAHLKTPKGRPELWSRPLDNDSLPVKKDQEPTENWENPMMISTVKVGKLFTKTMHGPIVINH